MWSESAEWRRVFCWPAAGLCDGRIRLAWPLVDLAATTLICKIVATMGDRIGWVRFAAGPGGVADQWHSETATKEAAHTAKRDDPIHSPTYTHRHTHSRAVQGYTQPKKKIKIKKKKDGGSPRRSGSNRVQPVENPMIGSDRTEADENGHKFKRAHQVDGHD